PHPGVSIGGYARHLGRPAALGQATGMVVAAPGRPGRAPDFDLVLSSFPACSARSMTRSTFCLALPAPTLTADPVLTCSTFQDDAGLPATLGNGSGGYSRGWGESAVVMTRRSAGSLLGWCRESSPLAPPMPHLRAGCPWYAC